MTTLQKRTANGVEIDKQQYNFVLTATVLTLEPLESYFETQRSA